MKVYIVSIGNELLEGSILDTNSNHIAKELFKRGIGVEGIFIVGDNENKLSNLILDLTKENSIIITTGGLGPTFDDITIRAVAKACGERLKLNKKLYFEILNKIKAKGVNLKISHLRQIYVPKNASIIKNTYGTAPGVHLSCKKSHIICLPGVPSEMNPMLTDQVIKIIKKIINPTELYSIDLKLTGVAESDAERFLKTLDINGVKAILNAMEGELAIRLRSENRDSVEVIKNQFQKNYGFKLYSTKDEKIEDVVGNLLDELDLSIGFIETTTSGILAQMMIDKACFTKSIVSSTVSDAALGLIDADIVACPCNLSGNEFELKLYINEEELSFNLRYLGNINFMRKSVAKRTLGFIYEYLKQHYD